MKISGRAIKQRLYGLKHLPSYLRRTRYFRGHGVHSPYVYSIVRHVFMQRKLQCTDHALYTLLLDKGISRRRAIQLTNLATHCNYASWSIDALNSSDIIFATLDVAHDKLTEYVDYAREHGITLCIMNPYNNAQRWAICSSIIENHPCTTVDNRAYLLVFNNHLPKQRFRL